MGSPSIQKALPHESESAEGAAGELLSDKREKHLPKIS
jgi:hypothetical protein